MRSQTTLPFLVLTLTVSVLVGCAGAAPQSRPASMPTAAPMIVTAAVAGTPEAVAPTGAPAEAGGSPQGPGKAPGPAQPVSRLVVLNADLAVVAKDPVATVQELQRLAESNDGYVVSSQTSQVQPGGALEKAAVRADITIRVPSFKLNSLLDQIRSMVVEVQSENITGQDVTDEYVDLQSRLRNLEAAEAQLQKFLDATTKPEDTLRIYDLLTAKQAEIEQVKGRMQYLQQSSALSAITVRISPQVTPTSTPTPTPTPTPMPVEGWRPDKTVGRATGALTSMLQSLADIGIWVALYVLPILLIIGVPIFLVFRFLTAAQRRQTRPTGQ